MRVAKFCENNLKTTSSRDAMNTLLRDYSQDVEVRVVDCFKRCLECRVKPFCRIQLTTIQADDATSLVEKILKNARQQT